MSDPRSLPSRVLPPLKPSEARVTNPGWSTYWPDLPPIRSAWGSRDSTNEDQRSLLEIYSMNPEPDENSSKYFDPLVSRRSPITSQQTYYNHPPPTKDQGRLSPYSVPSMILDGREPTQSTTYNNHEQTEFNTVMNSGVVPSEHMSALTPGLHPTSQLQKPSTPATTLTASARAVFHECNICGKKFRRPSGLKDHINAHIGVKPYLCPLETCRKAFTTRSNLIRHHNKVHRSRPKIGGIADIPGEWGDDNMSEHEPSPARCDGDTHDYNDQEGGQPAARSGSMEVEFDAITRSVSPASQGSDGLSYLDVGSAMALPTHWSPSLRVNDKDVTTSSYTPTQVISREDSPSIFTTNPSSTAWQANSSLSLPSSTPQNQQDDHLNRNTTLLLSEIQFEPQGGAVISRSMNATEIIQLLLQSGCPDVTRNINLHQCGKCPIAGGGFGDIYQGILSNGAKIAIKCPRLFLKTDEQGNSILKSIAREIYTWSKLKHRNVLELVGLATFRDQISIVSPWMENGTLPEYIAKNSTVDRLELCLEISTGLAYLHKSGVIHGDVKGANVLISATGVPKLTDFGNTILRKYTLEFTGGTTALQVSMRWTAPELLMGGDCYTKEADIFGLGMVFFEVVLGKIPFYGKPEHIACAHIIGRKTPEIPKDIENLDRRAGLLQNVMRRCWSFDAAGRPSASDVEYKLKEIASLALQNEAA